MKKITIAIDGYSSTGKSTIAKALAKKLEYIYVDTGAMYRAVTLYALNKKYIGPDVFLKEHLIKDLDSIEISFKYNPDLGYSEVLLNGKNVEKQIRTLEVSDYVSQVSAISAVRRMLVKQQQDLGKNKGVIMDGRDIGTVVFPDAELKVFMTASDDVRAKRRFNELQLRGDKVEFIKVLENVIKRDQIDSTREDSPLIKAKDAIEIDNSNQSLDEQISFLLVLAKERTK